MNKRQKRLGNKGFSLVELIVVIAIMAVLIAVLAPTLIGKIEESRVSTDLSTVSEIKTQITNMLADEDIYDKVVGTEIKTYELTNDLTFKISGGASVTEVETELKNVLEKFSFQSKAAKEAKEDADDPDTVTVKINSKGKVYVYIADKSDADKPVVAGDQELAAGNAPTEAPAGGGGEGGEGGEGGDA